MPDRGETTARESSFAALGAIVSGALILQIASTVVNMVVPLRMALAGEAPLLIGLVGSAYSVGFLVGCFIVPALVRRIGHIRGFAVFSALQAILTLSFALLPESWWGLPRLIMGLAGAGHAICIESWISVQAEGTHRGRILGLYQILNRLFLISSQIGVGYAAIASQDVFLVASMVFSLALVPVGLTHARTPQTAEVISVKLRTLWAQAPAAVVGCLYVGLTGGPLTTIAPAYGVMTGLDQKAALLLSAAIQAGALILQWPLSLMADKVQSRLIMLVAIGTATLASALALMLPMLGLLPGNGALYALFALIGGCSMPLYAVAVTHAYLRMGREQAVGLSAQLLFLWGVGSAIGPFVATVFIQAAGPRGFLSYLMLLSLAVAAYIAVRMRRNPSPAVIEPRLPAPKIPEVELGKT